MKNTNYNFGTRAFAENVEVSNDIRKSGKNGNDLIIGPSRSGKTGGYIFYSLKNPYGSYVVSDTKGQLSRIFTKHLKALGYKVETIDFVNPENGIGYNPLSYVKRDANGYVCQKDIKKLVTLIAPVLDPKEPFWDLSAQRYIGMLVGYVLEALPEEERNILSVVRMHRLFQGDTGRKLFEEWSEANPNSFSGGRYIELANTKDVERTWRCIIEFATQILEPFGYSEFNYMFSRPDTFDINALGKQKTVLFVNCSDNDTSFHVFSNMINTQITQNLIELADKNEDGRLDVPVRIIFDDFAAGPRIENLENLMSIVASREINVSLILQSISQLKSKYDNDITNTIVNNCDHILYLGGHDIETADFIGNYINKPRTFVLNKPSNKVVFIEDGSPAVVVNKLIPYAGVEDLKQSSVPADSTPFATNNEFVPPIATIDERIKLYHEHEEYMEKEYEYNRICQEYQDELEREYDFDDVYDAYGDDDDYDDEDCNDEDCDDDYDMEDCDNCSDNSDISDNNDVLVSIEVDKQQEKKNN